jgi:subtilisin family serine protease
LTWNIDRVDAEISWGISTGDPVKVGVIDTGIDLSHPDIKSNIKGGYNAIYPWKSPNDDNGHGTHVAGIIAALNNSIGVVGVGPNIDLYAIKVLNASGSGYLSDVIEGLDWAVTHGMQIVNMSLGTSQNVQSFHDAIVSAYNAGVVIVAAAGNSGGAVSYPAAYPEVIAVSATDQNNQIASFSSRGPEVDLAAPGVNIYSTYKGKSYATLSGTSMATPHVTGAAALVIDTKKCDLNSDNICTPAEVQQRLEQTAIDLGDPGKDNLYGYGLVNVYQALTQP